MTKRLLLILFNSPSKPNTNDFKDGSANVSAFEIHLLSYNKEIVDMVGIRPPEIFSMGKELHEDAFCYTVDEFLQSFV